MQLDIIDLKMELLLKSITRGLMDYYLPEEYENNLISAIRAGRIKEVK